MGRILAFDFGIKRTGIAVTDPLRIICSALDTVETPKVIDFIANYLLKEKVDLFVVGFPQQKGDVKISHSVPHIIGFIDELSKKFPDIPVETEDENYSSKQAMQLMIDGGLKKMQRRNKSVIDKVSASIILRNFLERNIKSDIKKY